jgi:hypothetical protein
MNGLHPIIRRKRRPLIEPDFPLNPTNPKPVQPVVKTPEVEPAKIVKPDDADNAYSSDAP